MVFDPEVDPLCGVKIRTGGVFTLAQARHAGYSNAEMRRLVRGGVWVMLRRGVYVEQSVLAVVSLDPQRRHALRIAALLLVLNRDAVAGGTSAAQILGLQSLALPTLELVVLTSEPVHNKRRNGYVIRSAALPAGHRRMRHGVPITSPARTVVDLARLQPLTEAVVVADSALRQGCVSLDDLRRVLGDCHCWRGIGQAQRAVGLADPESESVLESVSRVAMHEQGLPAPRTQVLIGDGEAPFARVDFLWPDVRVIGEADGLGKYESRGRRTTRDIVRAEKRREERLADRGYEIVRWGWEDAQDAPRLAQRLRAAFSRGAERMRGRIPCC
ncbi:MAG: hypothetical protein GEU74_13750 [Nitriliruptorales bacterium]|nr:hypothetical protein [Nitriliruptorales bacterium]